MKFYSISSFECESGLYAWASGYGPVDHMPFFDSFVDELKKRKLASWKINNSTPGIQIDKGGCEWSDVLGCGGGPPGEFFSERIIEDLRTEGIPFLRATEMPIDGILSKRLRDIPPPRYFVLEAEAGMEIRYESIPLEERIAAKKQNPPRMLGHSRTYIEPDTWDGKDLFSPSQGRALWGLYCSERVKELAERKGWTNIAFKAIGND